MGVVARPVWQALLSDKDPLKVLILERYRNKEVAYLETHKR